jgi:hypothetical protein
MAITNREKRIWLNLFIDRFSKICVIEPMAYNSYQAVDCNRLRDEEKSFSPASNNDGEFLDRDNSGLPGDFSKLLL